MRIHIKGSQTRRELRSLWSQFTDFPVRNSDLVIKLRPRERDPRTCPQSHIYLSRGSRAAQGVWYPRSQQVLAHKVRFQGWDRSGDAVLLWVSDAVQVGLKTQNALFFPQMPVQLPKQSCKKSVPKGLLSLPGMMRGRAASVIQCGPSSAPKTQQCGLGQWLLKP